MNFTTPQVSEGSNRLRAVLDLAWGRCMSEYQASRINGERTLQALMFSELRSAIAGTDLGDAFVICEPRFRLTDPTSGRSLIVIPDLVIVHGGRIVAAIELKFIPWHLVQYQMDLFKLSLLANEAISEDRQGFVGLRLDPTTGLESDETFQVAADCLLIFGAVARKDSAGVCRTSVEAHLSPVLAPRFHALLHPVG